MRYLPPPAASFAAFLVVRPSSHIVSRGARTTSTTSIASISTAKSTSTTFNRCPNNNNNNNRWWRNINSQWWRSITSNNNCSSSSSTTSISTSKTNSINNNVVVAVPAADNTVLAAANLNTPQQHLKTNDNDVTESEKASTTATATATTATATMEEEAFESMKRSIHDNLRPIRTVVVVGGTHGNEYTGIWVIKALERRIVAATAAASASATATATDTQEESKQYQKSPHDLYPSLKISTLLANPRAFLENRRFVDTDLNREFTKEKLMDQIISEESIRAKEIDTILGPKFPRPQINSDNDHDNDVVNGESSPPQQQQQKQQHEAAADFVLDLHTTTTNMGLTLIVPEGDLISARAAAYVAYRCGGSGGGGTKNDVRILVHPTPKGDPYHKSRPTLSSSGRHGLTIEVGPVPQGLLRHDAVQRTDEAVDAVFDFLEFRNQCLTSAISTTSDDDDVDDDNDSATVIIPIHPPELATAYQSTNYTVACYRSAPAIDSNSQSGRIPWPIPINDRTPTTPSSTSNDNNNNHPNFPLTMVHSSVQDRDFHHTLQTGDPLFVDIDGNVITYDGSHGENVNVVFVNEGGYYYKGSGAGVGVAVKAEYNLETGRLIV